MTTVRDLDPARIGQILINLVAASATAGHKHLRSTVRDYFDVDSPDAPDEARFIKDALTRPIPEVAAEWFGSGVDASWHMAGVISAALDAAAAKPMP